jgi:hypothetical protein
VLLTLIVSTGLYSSRPNIQRRSNAAMNLVIGVVADRIKLLSSMEAFLAKHNPAS